MSFSRLTLLAVLAWPAGAQTVLVSSVPHLDFQWSQPDIQSQAQTFTVTSAGGGEIDFQFSLDFSQAWVSILNGGTRTPATFTMVVRPSTSGRALGTSLTLTPSHGNPLVIPITQEYSIQNPSPDTAKISPATLAFTTTQGGNPPGQQLTTGATAVNAVSDRNWLKVNGDYGTFAPFGGSGTVLVGCDCAQLPSGTYSGVIHVQGGYLGPIDTVPVSLTVSPPVSGGLSAAASSLAFDYQIGGNLPAAQTVSISSTTSTAASFRAAATSQGGNWLSVTPASATTPASVSVSVNPTGLSPATYSGSVTLTPNAGTAITLPVTLTVRAAAPIAASATSLSFAYRQGDLLPASQSVQVSGGGASPSFSVTVPDTATWLKPSPVSGTAPAAIAVAIDPGKLAPGNYQANLTIAGTGSASGSATISVTLQVTAPLPTIAKIVNAASYVEGAVAPGEIVTIFGTAIGPDALAGLLLDSFGGVSRTLSAVQVLFDGTPAPLIYVSKSQIAAVAPYEIAGRQDTTVLIAWNGQRSNGITLPVTTTAPAIFTANSSGTGPGAIAHVDGSINSATNPAAAGDTVIVYVTGEGQTAPKGVTGSVTQVSTNGPLTPAPVLAVAVLIGGLPAQFSFAGEAPGFVAGVMQLNVQIPAGLSAGAQPISVGVGGRPSQSGVTVSVK